MRSDILIRNHPPTPPAASTKLQPSLHLISEYTGDGSFSYGESHSQSVEYNSPGPVANEGIPSQSSQVESHSGGGLGLGGQYDGFGQGSGYYQDNQYNGNELANNQAAFSGSPPTPKSPVEVEHEQTSPRSTRTIPVTASPRVETKTRPKATPKSKKNRGGKSEKPKTPKLTAPLSALTKNMAHIPIRDMEEWVNRTADVRRKEVEKRNGYVTRPMNSFMLYRSAYAERTKQWCLQNNHQVVSSVSGESWPMEPAEIRDMYNEYAKIERINHQNAHPTYKFSPSKASTPSRKRKGEYSDGDEPSDLEDADWAPGHGRSRIRHSRRPDRALSYPVNNMSTGFFDRSFGPNSSSMSKSSWDITAEGRPMPMPIGHGDLYNVYYQSSIHQSMDMGQGVMDDMRIRRADSPISSMQFSPDHALLGLPGGNGAELLQHFDSQSGTPVGVEEQQVDPLLFAFGGDGHGQHDLDPASVQHQHSDFQNGQMGMLDGELDQHGVESLLGTVSTHHDEFHSGTWQPDAIMGPMEQEPEFEKWMGDD